MVFLSVLTQLLKMKTSEEKREATDLLKQRILDDQYKINSEKNIIRNLLKCDFKEEYRTVLAKMHRFCTEIWRRDEQGTHLDFDRNILDLDIIPFFEDNLIMKLKNATVKSMGSEAEKAFEKIFPI